MLAAERAWVSSTYGWHSLSRWKDTDSSGFHESLTLRLCDMGICPGVLRRSICLADREQSAGGLATENQSPEWPSRATGEIRAAETHKNGLRWENHGPSHRHRGHVWKVGGTPNLWRHTSSAWGTWRESLSKLSQEEVVSRTGAYKIRYHIVIPKHPWEFCSRDTWRPPNPERKSTVFTQNLQGPPTHKSSLIYDKEM